MESKTSSDTIAGYHVILPKLDKKRDPVQDIAKGLGMISGGRINFQMGAVEVFITMVCGVLGTIFLMNVSRLLVKFKGLNAFLAYVGQNSLTVRSCTAPLCASIAISSALPVLPRDPSA